MLILETVAIIVIIVIIVLIYIFVIRQQNNGGGNNSKRSLLEEAAAVPIARVPLGQVSRIFGRRAADANTASQALGRLGRERLHLPQMVQR